MIPRRFVYSLLGTLRKYQRCSLTEFSAPQINWRATQGWGGPFRNWESKTSEVVVGSYRVIYRVREDEVHLLTVHHGARLLDTSKIEAGA